MQQVRKRKKSDVRGRKNKRRERKRKGIRSRKNIP